MAVTNLSCRECGTEYELTAQYVCTKCFGPLEVKYDHSALEGDVASLRRRITSGPQNIWRYVDFLPLVDGQPGPEREDPLARRPARRLHAAGARRPARRAPGPQGGLGQERRAQPDALLQGPRRLRRRRPRAGARLRHAGLRLDGQPRQRRGRHGRRAGDAVLRLHPGRPRGAEDPRDRRLRHQPGQDQRQLRRRQPALHRDQRRAGELGVRQRQHAALLRRGLQDLGLRDRRAARLLDAGPRGRADRLGLAVHQARQGL